MNSDNESADLELLKRYRRVSDAAPSQPNDAVREAILAEGRRAAARNAPPASHQFDTHAPAANRLRWRYAAIGTACAAVLAGFLVIPQFMMRPPEVAMVSEPKPLATSRSAAPLTDKAAPAPKTEELEAPERDLANGPSALINIPRSRAKLSSDAPAVQALQKAPTPPVMQGNETAIGNLAGEARRSAASGDATQQTTRQLSSDLKQITVAPEAAPAATPAPVSPTPEIPSGASGGSAPSPRAAAAPAPSSGAESDHGLNEIVLTARRADRPPPTPLISAINWGQAGKAAALLQNGKGSVTETDSKGRTPLHRAVEHKRLDLVRLLLANGADPNVADADGQTPLSLARHKKLADIVTALETASKQPP